MGYGLGSLQPPISRTWRDQHPPRLEGAVVAIALSWTRGAQTNWKAPRMNYCLSKTLVAVNSLPSALVPLMLTVIVFPPFEITVRAVA